MMLGFTCRIVLELGERDGASPADVSVSVASLANILVLADASASVSDSACLCLDPDRVSEVALFVVTHFPSSKPLLSMSKGEDRRVLAERRFVSVACWSDI